VPFVVNIGGAIFDKSWTYDTPYVTTDNPAVAKLAVQHFLDQGFTNFAYCGIRQTPFNPWSRMRGNTFQETLNECGFECSTYFGRHTSARQWEAVQKGLCNWLESLPLPVGLFACNDARARHVQEACRRIGLRIPTDVAVLGVDNDELMCELANPMLSSIALGTDTIGFESAQLLDDLISGRRISESRRWKVVPPLGVVVRESTNTIAIADELVARAVEYIRSRTQTGVCVTDVIKELDVSRSTLDNRFREQLNRTVHDEIERCRLERTKELLTTTNDTLTEIAAQTGFSSVQYLASVFRKSTAQTPGQYRQQFKSR
jgi:LacI family transcriptional regulator